MYELILIENIKIYIITYSEGFIFLIKNIYLI